MNTHRPRVLIFVAAYEAESKLQRVLNRIPRPMFERFDAEVLVIDDSSSDRTFEVGMRSAGASSHPITVFYNRTNQGYGGNQKLGYQYALKLGYDSSHTAALGAVPSGARVMGIGCGPGGFDRLLVDKACAVTGADQFPPAHRPIFKNFVVWNEQVPLEIRSGDYDYVLLLDIIEHLKQPEVFLDRLRRSLGSLDGRPKIIVTTGNVVFLIVRLQALLGNFNYSKRGILDLTHTRLYTFGTLRKLFEQCGFVVEEVRGIPAPFPAALGFNAFSRLLLRVNGFLIRLSRGLFSYRIFMRVAPTPTVDALLEDSMAGSITRASEARRAQQEEQRRRPAVQSASETPV
jgi:glycosyltransferase involved in cell wall biosynthesis